MTNPTDWRALCARMADELDHYRQLLMDDRSETHALAAEARTALAQPEPQGPTVMQILALSDEIEAEELGTIDLVRRALARWGRPSIEPVPVSERLPKGNDFDAEGCCWWWSRDIYAWCQCFAAAGDSSEWTHWLPHWALPVPQQEAE